MKDNYNYYSALEAYLSRADGHSLEARLLWFNLALDSSEERVEGVQFFREEYFKSKGIEFREDGKRLRRVFRIIT